MRVVMHVFSSCLLLLVLVFDAFIIMVFAFVYTETLGDIGDMLSRSFRNNIVKFVVAVV